MFRTPATPIPVAGDLYWPADADVLNRVRLFHCTGSYNASRWAASRGHISHLVVAFGKAGFVVMSATWAREVKGQYQVRKCRKSDGR